MEPLFETTIQHTFEEYKKYCWAVSLKSKKFWVFSSFYEIFMICMGVLGIIYHWHDIILLASFFVIFYPMLFVLRSRSAIKKNWDSNKLFQGVVSHYRFFEDHMEQNNELGSSGYPYDKLYSILETKTNFYIMLGRNQGALIKKENCSEGLIAFLQNLKKSR